MDIAFEQTLVFEKKFNRVFREIRELESKIYKKGGFWIFKTHVYSKEALKNSEHHVKIDSITNKIGSDALSWNRFGQLTQQARAVYEIKDDEVKYELERLNSLIESREPTWWEEFKSELNKFVVEIVRNMPPLAKGFLGGVLQTLKFLGLPGFFKPSPQLSPFDNDV